MFLPFLYHLRAQGVPVGTHEWLSLMKALEAGQDAGSLTGLYHLGRAILVHTEGHYDGFDIAFARFFQDLDIPDDVRKAFEAWLNDPAREQGKSGQAPPILSQEELAERLKELLAEQKERHDGGNYFVGTRGVSPLGTKGENPQGMQMAASGGGNRQAVFQAGSRRYQNYREDITLDVRHFKAALKGLRHLHNEGPEILDLDGTIHKSARNLGDIELAWKPDRKNAIKLLLLMDVGGSMEPHRQLVSRLFSASHAARHFKRFEFRYFHNCPYSRVYTDMAQWNAQPTEEMLRKLPRDFRVIFVGDACMAPWELGAANDWYALAGGSQLSGLDWIRRIKKHFCDAIWLNPEPESTWNHPTIRSIGNAVDMFPLTLAGLRDAVKHLRRSQNHRTMSI